MRIFKSSETLKTGAIFRWNDAWKIKKVINDSVVFLQESNAIVPLHESRLERARTLNLSGCYFQVTKATPAESCAILYDAYSDQPVRGKNTILLNYSFLTQPRPKKTTTPRQKAEQLKTRHARQQCIKQSGLRLVQNS